MRFLGNRKIEIQNSQNSIKNPWCCGLEAFMNLLIYCLKGGVIEKRLDG
jgi:hypothetical protein